MRDYLVIGSVPASEPCEQLGENYDSQRATIELRAFRNQIERTKTIPEGAYLSFKTFPHDFGSYKELVANYDDSIDDEEFYEELYALEEIPEYWDEEAKKELKEAGYYH
jgi:hypothetical protein